VSLIRDQILFLLQADRFVEREPGDIICVELISDERIRAVEVGFVLGVQVNNKEHILPQVVLLLDVMHETILGVLINL